MDLSKFDILRTASELAHPGIGAWLFDTWRAHNEQYFAGSLEVIPLIWGLTPHGGSLGYYSPGINRITLHTSLLRPAGDAWGLSGILGITFASDVMLHEMMHQAIYQRLGNDGSQKSSQTSHNNPAWVAEINRIAPMLGLPANAALITQKRVKPEGQKGKGKVTWFVEEGNLSRAELASWPHLARPEGYYGPEAEPLLEQVRSAHL